jgi:PAS domain-containing protein
MLKIAGIILILTSVFCFTYANILYKSNKKNINFLFYAVMFSFYSIICFINSIFFLSDRFIDSLTYIQLSLIALFNISILIFIFAKEDKNRGVAFKKIKHADLLKFMLTILFVLFFSTYIYLKYVRNFFSFSLTFQNLNFAFFSMFFKNIKISTGKFMFLIFYLSFLTILKFVILIIFSINLIHCIRKDDSFREFFYGEFFSTFFLIILTLLYLKGVLTEQICNIYSLLSIKFLFMTIFSFLLTKNRFLLFYLNGQWNNIAINESDVGILYIDDEGHILSANKRVLELTGQSIQKLQRMSFRDIIKIDYENILVNRNERNNRDYEGEKYDNDMTIARLKKANLLEIPVYFELLKLTKKENIYILLIYSFEIGEKINESRADKDVIIKNLNSQRLFLDKFLDQLPDGFLLADENYKILKCDEKASKLIGLEIDNLLNKDIRLLDENIIEDPENSYLKFLKDLNKNFDINLFFDKSREEKLVFFEKTQKIAILRILKVDFIDINKIYLLSSRTNQTKSIFYSQENEIFNDGTDKNQVAEKEKFDNEPDESQFNKLFTKKSYLYIFTDLTESIEKLKSIYNGYKAFIEFFEKNPYPMLIVKKNGFIERYNRVFTEIWETVEHNDLKYKNLELVNYIEKDFKDSENFGSYQVIDLWISPEHFEVISFFQDQSERKGIFGVNDNFDLIYQKYLSDISSHLNSGLRAYRLYLWNIPEIFDKSSTSLLLFFDITEKIKKTALLMNTVKKSYILSSKNRNLIINLNHEIRTPLNLILGISDLIVENADESADKGLISSLASDIKKLDIFASDVISLSSSLLYQQDLFYESFEDFIHEFGVYIRSFTNYEFYADFINDKISANYLVNLSILKKILYFLSRTYKSYGKGIFHLVLDQKKRSISIDFEAKRLVNNDFKYENPEFDINFYYDLTDMNLKYYTRIVDGSFNMESDLQSIKISLIVPFQTINKDLHKGDGISKNLKTQNLKNLDSEKGKKRVKRSNLIINANSNSIESSKKKIDRIIDNSSSNFAEGRNPNANDYGIKVIFYVSNDDATFNFLETISVEKPIRYYRLTDLSGLISLLKSELCSLVIIDWPSFDKLNFDELDLAIKENLDRFCYSHEDTNRKISYFKGFILLFDSYERQNIAYEWKKLEIEKRFAILNISLIELPKPIDLRKILEIFDRFIS